MAELGAVEADGIVSSKDRGALLAAVLADRAGLPGPSPQAVASLQHKPTAREIQERAVPEATPRWFVPGHGPVPFPPPWFVKPAVGRLSMGAQQVNDAAALPEEGVDDYAAGWESLARLGGVDLDGQGWIAEDVLAGAPLTVEGYVHAGRVTIVGVTDSVMYDGTLSFERFEYPSRLPAERVSEVSALAARLPGAFGVRQRLLQRRMRGAGFRPGHADRAERAHRVTVRAASTGGSRPLELRRAARARLRRRPALGHVRAGRRGRQLRAAALRGRVGRRGARAARTASRSSSTQARTSPTRTRTTRAASAWRSSTRRARRARRPSRGRGRARRRSDFRLAPARPA